METKELSSAYLLNREMWAETLKAARRNPSLMLKAGVDYLVQNTNGKLDFVDASNPATLLMEFASQLSANNLNYFAEADRKHYPILATQMSDLYPHMSNTLYQGMYSVPSRTVFRLEYRVSDILKNAEVTEVEGQRKIIIPRGTVFQVDGVDFTILNPVEIRVNAFDNIQVIYNTDRVDTLEILKSNILEYFFRKRTDTEEEWLVIELPVLQLTRTVVSGGLTHIAEPFNQNFNFPHKFVKARVYFIKEDGSREEIKTTHSTLVYNPSEPTAIVKVLNDGLLNVHIPMIYYSNRSITHTQVRVEIYSTRGEVSIPTKTLSMEKGVGADYSQDDHPVSESKYIAPLETMDTVALALTDTIGGRNEVSFSKMKGWVVSAGRYDEETITHANLRVKADILGYDLITDIDHLTNRTFQATRELEATPDSEFSRGVGCSIESVPFRMSDLEKHDFVNKHEDRLTLLPDALFKTIDGVTTLLYTSEIPTLASTGSVDAYIQRINSLEYIKTPFHYCFDDSGSAFEVRPYYMQDPSYLFQNFVEANNKTDLTMAVDKVEIFYQDYGYLIRVTTRSSEEMKKVNPEDTFVQLAYLPDGQLEHAYINGEFIGLEDKNFVYEFKIETTFDFDARHRLMVNNFKILTREKRVLPCKLKQTFKVIFGCYDYEKGSDRTLTIHRQAADFILNHARTPMVVAVNEIGVKLGDNLKNLWHNTRTTVSTLDFKRYKEDIPLRYVSDVPVVDPQTNLPKYRMENGRMVFELAHQAGDPILDKSGTPLLKHRQGDIMLDSKGEPIVENPKQVLRIVDLFFYDGIYHFSNHEEDLKYIKTIPALIANWLENDIDRLQRNLLENSDLFFMPKRTMGYINILAENGVERTIFNRLPFRVTFYLTDKAWRNTLLKESIRKMTYRVINEMLTHRTVSKDIIENALRVQGGEENILGVNIVDMGLGPDVNTFTMVDSGSQCSVRRKISLTEDNHMKVKEDIEILFVNHDKRLTK